MKKLLLCLLFLPLIIIADPQIYYCPPSLNCPDSNPRHCTFDSQNGLWQLDPELTKSFIYPQRPSDGMRLNQVRVIRGFNGKIKTGCLYNSTVSLTSTKNLRPYRNGMILNKWTIYNLAGTNARCAVFIYTSLLQKFCPLIAMAKIK